MLDNAAFINQNMAKTVMEKNALKFFQSQYFSHFIFLSLVHSNQNRYNLFGSTIGPNDGNNPQRVIRQSEKDTKITEA